MFPKTKHPELNISAGKRESVRCPQNGARQLGFANLAALIDSGLDRISASGVAGWHPFVLGILLSIIAIVLAFPHYMKTFDTSVADRMRQEVMQVTEWKFEHPLQPIPIDQFFGKDSRASEEGFVNHLRKRSYRIAVPLVANVLGLNVQSVAVLQQVGALLFLTITLLLLRRITQDELVAFVAAIYMAATYPGQWGFNDDHFDGIAYLAMLISVWSRSFIIVVVAVVFGGLTDERAIIAAPLVYLCHSIIPAADKPPEKGWLKPFLPGRLHWAVICGVLVFGIIRIYLGIRWGALVDTSGLSLAGFNVRASLFPLMALNLVKGGIFILAAGFLVAIAKREFATVVFTSLALIPALGVVAFAWDFTRSLAYGFLTFFIAMAVIVRNVELVDTRRLVSFAVICSLFVPTYFLIAAWIFM
jgi:hypothetical protein